MWHIWELPPKFLEIQAIVLLRKAYGRISNTQRKIFGEACKERSGEFPPYYDTTNSARDLHHHESHRSKKSYSILDATLLGETFAALFPQAFDHLILDGVVDGELQYGFGDVLPSSIQDAEKAFQIFFDSCFKAGPGLCILHRLSRKDPCGMKRLRKS